MSRRTGRNRQKKSFLSHDVAAILATLEQFLNLQDEHGRIACNARCGVYAFLDYEGEPIYVGQTKEQLRVRIRRHLTNQRTDAVAMRVLDPAEVAEIEVWPLWELEDSDSATVSRILNAAEWTLYQQVIRQSPIGKVLNEKAPAETDLIELPKSYRTSIVPDELRTRLGHKDVRIARRADTIAGLARIVTERDVNLGLRSTLVTQAQRLERLARERYQEVLGETPPRDRKAETTHRESESEE